MFAIVAVIFIPRGRSMIKEMKAYAHLKPGQKGTMRLQQKYGDTLLCVRYRYDEIREVKLKTVEIIVDECVLQWCLAAGLTKLDLNLSQ
jgi:hypothetical protein